MKLSVILIVKNEEKMIRGCLESLKFADEVVVLDTGSSTDLTKKIANKYTNKVYDYKGGKNFSDWRNKAVEYSKGDWILYVDADERIPKDLAQEIRSKINSESAYSWYVIPRNNVIFGRVFKHGGFYPDYVKRLFKSDSLIKWKGDLHEEPEVKGEMGYLTSPMQHIKHESVFEMVEKTNAWSEIEGRLMFEANHPDMNIPRFVSAMWREFYYRMIKNMAFLDGWEGIIMAIYQVFSRFCSYAKLWELQEKKRLAASTKTKLT